MTLQTLRFTSIVGGGLATIIVALSGAVLDKAWGANITVAALVGVGSSLGLYFAFKNRVGKKGC